MSLHTVWQKALDFHSARTVVVEPSEAKLTSDAGLLALRQFDQQIGLSQRLIDAIGRCDKREPSRLTHSMAVLLRQRFFGILAGYEDQNDHDRLRHDPALQLVCDRLPADRNDNGVDPAALGSQPTLSLFAFHAPCGRQPHRRSGPVESAGRSDRSMARQLRAATGTHHTRCGRLRRSRPLSVLSRGQQQLTLFHGYYGQNQYLPIIWTDEGTGMTLLVGLRHGTCAAYLGADDDLEYIVRRVREKWPPEEHPIEVELRADSGFGSPVMYAKCEELGVSYTIGIGMNAVFKRLSEDLLTEAVSGYEATNQKQRLFMTFAHQAGKWTHPRQIVLKAEAHSAGTNRRAVVTNRPGAAVLPQATYDEYVRRGESENRNKELKCDLAGDRLSNHRFMANFFRLYLHASALNLLVRLRNQLPEPAAKTSAPRVFVPHRANLVTVPDDGSSLRRATPTTWRMRLVKVAAEVTVSARRVLVRLSGSWPHLPTYEAVLTRLGFP